MLNNNNVLIIFFFITILFFVVLLLMVCSLAMCLFRKHKTVCFHKYKLNAQQIKASAINKFTPLNKCACSLHEPKHIANVLLAAGLSAFKLFINDLLTDFYDLTFVYDSKDFKSPIHCIFRQAVPNCNRIPFYLERNWQVKIHYSAIDI